MRQLTIIGSGPAGLTAAIYAARANLRPVVIASSVTPGGELTNTTEVENYPGFPDGIQGPELMEKILVQAEKFGAEAVYEDVASLELTGDTKTVTLGDGTTRESRAVIFAAGSAYRKLGVPGEGTLSGFGVSWCATCDGFFFRDKVVAVAGGGDSAAEEALFLTKFASRVHLLNRGPELRASQIMQDRLAANEKVTIHREVGVHQVVGNGKVEAIEWRDTRSEFSRVEALAVDGLFVAIGSDPRTHLVHGQLDLNADGTIAVDGRSSRTNLQGVFAAGDVIDPTYRQAVTAAASGTVAAIDAEHYLAGLS